jgi:uncharacterized cupin superfamily protein
MGGERGPIEIGEFPRHHKRVIRDRNDASIIDDDAIQPFFSTE